MQEPKPYRSIPVRFKDGVSRSYAVFIGRGLLRSLSDVVRAHCPGASRLLVAMDAGAAEHDPSERLSADGWNVGREVVEATETNKTLATFERLVRRLAMGQFERTDAVIAVGGGVVGDVAGFAAACYRRGIPVIQCPTTLLAMVDASVGGKTGVNLGLDSAGLLKNVVGVFHQPWAVVVDVDVLATLPDRHLAAGLAECIKHSLICRSVPVPDEGLLEWTRLNLANARRRELVVLEELIARNVSLKAGVVGADEREEASDEEGGRALLNLGHTFGHVVETLPSLRDCNGNPVSLLHGEAVGLGLIAAARAAKELHPRSAGMDVMIEEMLEAAGLPVRIGGLPPVGVLLERLAHDKKARDGSVRVVLPVAPGVARVMRNPPESVLAAAFGAMCD